MSDTSSTPDPKYAVVERVREGFSLTAVVTIGALLLLVTLFGTFFATRRIYFQPPTPTAQPTAFPMQEVTLEMPDKPMTYTKELVTQDNVPLRINAIIPKQPTPPPPAPTPLPAGQVVLTTTYELPLVLEQGVLSLPKGQVLQADAKRGLWLVMRPVDGAVEGWMPIKWYLALGGSVDALNALNTAGDLNPDEKAAAEAAAKAKNVITTTHTLTSTTMVTITTKAITHTGALTKTATLTVTAVVTKVKVALSIRKSWTTASAQLWTIPLKGIVSIHARSADGKWFRTRMPTTGKDHWVEGWMDGEFLIFSSGFNPMTLPVSTTAGTGLGDAPGFEY